MKSNLLFALLSISIFACQSPNSTKVEGLDKDTTAKEATYLEQKAGIEAVLQRDSLTVTALEDFYTFDSVPQLGLNEPMDKAVIEQQTVDFDFTVANFQLGEQTPLPPSATNLANSDNGQHIHLILNNGPYKARYQSTFSEDLPEGHHYAVAFLARSYHLSVKNPQAYRAFQFTVKESQPNQPKLYPLNEPTLFYSRPKGTYTAEESKNLLFDFYLHNVELTYQGFNVKLTIDGENEYLISKWQPYVVKGLEAGTHIFKIELLNTLGESVNPEVNTVIREIKIEKALPATM
jgi:hypothetical protein